MSKPFSPRKQLELYQLQTTERIQQLADAILKCNSYEEYQNICLTDRVAQEYYYGDILERLGSKSEFIAQCFMHKPLSDEARYWFQKYLTEKKANSITQQGSKEAGINLNV